MTAKRRLHLRLRRHRRVSIPELLHSFADASEQDDTSQILARDYVNSTEAVDEMDENEIAAEDGGERRVRVRVRGRQKRYAYGQCDSSTCSCFAVCDDNCDCRNHCVCGGVGCRYACTQTCLCSCQGRNYYGQSYGCSSYACQPAICHSV